MRVSRRIAVDGDRPDEAAIAAGARTLRGGGIVVFPTETFYGLAADASSEVACRRIYEVKGRPREKALPCIASDLEQVERFTGALPDRARRLAERFWPGPLSLVLDAVPGLAAAAEDGTVAVRVSGLPLARKLAAALGGLVTATSANLAGDPPAATWPEVSAGLGDAFVELVLDGGACRGGLPSTLVDVRSGPPRLLREGSIPMKEVTRWLAGASSS